MTRLRKLIFLHWPLVRRSTYDALRIRHVAKHEQLTQLQETLDRISRELHSHKLALAEMAARRGAA